MTLLSPERLWLLLLVVALAGLYVWTNLRRRQRAVRFTNLEVLRSVVPVRAAWRRHVPAAGVALALAALVVGIAHPVRQVRVPKRAATLMLVLDMSASMRATDVSPSRVEAAISAAKKFVEDLPAQVKVGLVSFDRFPTLVSTPTLDHRSIRTGLDRLTLGPGTAAGDAIYVALDALDSVGAAPGTAPGSGLPNREGAAIVLLSDGVTTVGSPVQSAAADAKDRGIPVSTISFGTDAGSVYVNGDRIAVPADPETMADVADITGGKAFKAASGDELRSIYEDIGTRVSFESLERDNSGPVLTLAAVALALSFGLAILWNGRLV